MKMQVPPEEPNFGPWQLEPVQAFVRRFTKVLGIPARPLVVAIDGRSASGKTTLAAVVGRAVPNAAVVHTDDVAWHHSFFDWTELVLDGVLGPARAGRAVRYRPSAWEERGREGAVEVPAGCSMLVLEGVGAARRELMHALDAVVWVQSDMDQARTRGLIRDGRDAAATAFWDDWMTGELSFLADQRPWERANVVVTGTSDLSYDLSSHVAVAMHDALVNP